MRCDLLSLSVCSVASDSVVTELKSVMSISFSQMLKNKSRTLSKRFV